MVTLSQFLKAQQHLWMEAMHQCLHHMQIKTGHLSLYMMQQWSLTCAHMHNTLCGGGTGGINLSNAFHRLSYNVLKTFFTVLQTKMNTEMHDLECTNFMAQTFAMSR